jgi:hypothetical protein
MREPAIVTFMGFMKAERRNQLAANIKARAVRDRDGEG